MTPKTLPRLRRVCRALPKTRYDERFESLSFPQQLLALALTSAVVLAVPPLLFDASEWRVAVAVALAFGTLHGVSTLLARYGRP